MRLLAVAKRELRRLRVSELRRHRSYWRQHAREAYSEPLPFDPDWSLLRRLEETGQLLMVGMFVDGRLVGHAALTIYRHAMSRGKVAAQEIALYICREFRSFGTASLLIRAMERMAQVAGCSQIILHVPARARRLGTLYARLGYRPLFEVHGKELKSDGVGMDSS
ncbi:MAG TPA: GNAT family N-acetyltransferase [bacterium]|nr:GNAT family N-acetyltransferase [bacterium]